MTSVFGTRFAAPIEPLRRGRALISDGPGYFVALRVVHDTLGTDWLTAGKILGFASTLGILAVGSAQAWLAIGLLALLPDVIHSMYSDLTVPFGSFWILAAVTDLTGWQCAFAISDPAAASWRAPEAK